MPLKLLAAPPAVKFVQFCIVLRWKDSGPAPGARERGRFATRVSPSAQDAVATVRTGTWMVGVGIVASEAGDGSTGKVLRNQPTQPKKSPAKPSAMPIS